MYAAEAMLASWLATKAQRAMAKGPCASQCVKRRFFYSSGARFVRM
jgi:hypothetical protein